MSDPGWDEMDEPDREALRDALGYDYGEAVNAPMSEATIAALAAKLASGDYPVRKVRPVVVRPMSDGPGGA